jgi:pentatricopeptide repeat protein
MGIEAFNFFKSVRNTPVWAGPYRSSWYSKLISCAVRTKDIDKAEELYLDCVESKVEVREDVYLSLLAGCEVSNLGREFQPIHLFITGLCPTNLPTNCRD